MTNRLNARAAIALSLAPPTPVRALDVTSRETARRGFTVTGVISVASRDPRITTNAAEVRRQGDSAKAGSVRWLATAPVIANCNSTVAEELAFFLRHRRDAMWACEIGKDRRPSDVRIQQELQKLGIPIP